MPTRFLSDAEITRLDGWPEAIEHQALGRYFGLDGEDLVFVRRQHNAAGQLGIALQLCALRWLGFFPEDLSAASAEAISALADALDVPARAIFEYSVRPQTRWEHRPLVRECLPGRLPPRPAAHAGVGRRAAVLPPTGSGSPPAPAGPGSRRCPATSVTAAEACRSTHGPQTSTANTPARS